jgi:MinD superfamily P-loop ATPase
VFANFYFSGKLKIFELSLLWLKGTVRGCAVCGVECQNMALHCRKSASSLILRRITVFNFSIFIFNSARMLVISLAVGDT